MPFKRPVRAFVLAGSVAAIAVALPTTARASDIGLARSPALECLTVAAGATGQPDYPPAHLEKKEGGTVRVELEFNDPAEAPAVRLVARTGHNALNEAVANYVTRFRVPCMNKADGPVTLVQQYVFDPDGAARAVADKMRDRADVQRNRQMGCLVHKWGSAPDYPPDALKAEHESNLIVRMRFSASDQPPVPDFLWGAERHSMREAVTKHIAGWRLPCLSSTSLDVVILYKFAMRRPADDYLRDMDLVQLVANARSVPRPAYFDFDKMGCPFKLRMEYGQPFRDNNVWQGSSPVAARKPFMAWLEGLTLNFDKATSGKVFGSKFIVTVPCGRLDI